MPTRLATVSPAALAVGGGSSLTFSHTVDSGTDVLLVCVSLIGSTPGVSGVTFNGVALTNKADASSGDSLTRVSWWYLLSPTPATANVVVTLDSAERGGAFAVNYDGVDVAGTPFGTGNTGAATSTTPTVNIASASGELVVTGIGARNGDTTTATVNGGSEIANFIGSPGAGANSLRVAGADETGAVTVTADYTLSGSAEWRIGGFSLKPAGGGGGGTTAYYYRTFGPGA